MKRETSRRLHTTLYVSLLCLLMLIHSDPFFLFVTRNFIDKLPSNTHASELVCCDTVYESLPTRAIFFYLVERIEQALSSRLTIKRTPVANLAQYHTELRELIFSATCAHYLDNVHWLRSCHEIILYQFVRCLFLARANTLAISVNTEPDINIVKSTSAYAEEMCHIRCPLRHVLVHVDCIWLESKNKSTETEIERINEEINRREWMQCDNNMTINCIEPENVLFFPRIVYFAFAFISSVTWNACITWDPLKYTLAAVGRTAHDFIEFQLSVRRR